jgi:hypothetical protein
LKIVEIVKIVVGNHPVLEKMVAMLHVIKIRT